MIRRSLASLAVLLVAALPVVVGGSVRAEDREEHLDASHVKVGQTYRFKLTAGNSSVWEVVGKTDAEVRYKIRCTVAGKELATGQDEVHVFPLKRKAEGKDAPKGQAETLKVSGVEFACTILEAQSAGTNVKTWRSPRFPETIKVQLGTDVTAELVEIAAPK